MAFPSPLRPGVITGLLLLACWLGWVTTSLAALGQRPAGDAATVTAMLEELRVRGQLPATGKPAAIRLNALDCNCETPAQAWADIADAMRDADGQVLDTTLTNTAGHELLVLAADGSARYAGPMSPTALSCGRSDNLLVNGLPELLAVHSPPLFLPPRCSC
ncbi:MAG: hypothetical protein ACREP4_07020 [Stenotrophomonas sp.]|uniref:hypothetical protein n=1 Tax=Stenotrophomonas sp. TaxID=69392 RepID=UPI003D6DA691